MFSVKLKRTSLFGVFFVKSVFRFYIFRGNHVMPGRNQAAVGRGIAPVRKSHRAWRRVGGRGVMSREGSGASSKGGSHAQGVGCRVEGVEGGGVRGWHCERRRRRWPGRTRGGLTKKHMKTKNKK